ncbi:MAG: ATP-binding protein [Aminipila sp.]
MKETRSFTTTILWAFVLLNIISLMIFTFSVKYEDGERALTSAKTSLSEIVTEKAKLISISLKNIEDKTESMADWAEYFLQQETPEKLANDYIINENTGVMTRTEPIRSRENEKSAVFFPNNAPITDEIIREVNATENLDPVFRSILNQEHMLKWVYIATKKDFLRVMPYHNQDVFDSNHKQTDDTFYKIAVGEKNPERSSVWTEPYVDYLGTGWMVSCSHPVYDANDNLFGVVCADVGIEEIKQEFLMGFKLGESGKIYLLTNTGNIIYHPDYQKRAEKQGELYGKNIFDDKALSTNKIKAIEGALKEKESIFEFTDKGKDKMIAGGRIEGQPWTVVIEIDKQEFLSQNRIDGKVLTQLIFIGLVLAIVLAIILYYEFSVPMRTLVEGVRSVSNGGFGRVRTNTGFLEINVLSEAFNNMNDNLQMYTESILRKKNEISTILNAIYDVVMIIDSQGNVKIANENSLERISEENKYIGKCYAILANRNKKCDNCILDLVLETKMPLSRQEVIGGEIYKNTYYPIIELSGDVKEVVVLSQCITKSLAMERELQQIEKMAGIGQFSAAIAHEIKNPLAVIKGATYIMNTYNKVDSDAGTYTEEIELINNAVKEAEHVITTLLDFSSKDDGEGGFVELEKLVEQILMISRKEIIKRGIDISVELEVESFFYCDKIELIKIILQNLINNAIQAVSNNGKITVYSKRATESSIILGVMDNGPGIPVNPKSKIFEPFMTTKKDSGGTGIGLWITRTLVDGIDGQIWIDEEKQDGTDIKVEIPILSRTDILFLENRGDR